MTTWTKCVAVGALVVLIAGCGEQRAAGSEGAEATGLEREVVFDAVTIVGEASPEQETEAHADHRTNSSAAVVRTLVGSPGTYSEPE